MKGRKKEKVFNMRILDTRIRRKNYQRTSLDGNYGSTMIDCIHPMG